MDAFADSDIGFAVCTWDDTPSSTEEYCQCRLGTAIPAHGGGIYSFFCPLSLQSNRGGVHFEGFYRDKCTERATLALSILTCSSSSRRSSSFTLKSQPRLSIFDISLRSLVLHNVSFPLSFVTLYFSFLYWMALIFFSDWYCIFETCHSRFIQWERWQL